MRTRHIVTSAAIMSCAFTVGCLLLLAQGRWPAYLDLSPLNNGWPLVFGADDKVPDAPLFHLAAWVASFVFGMGGGVAAVTWTCVFVFLTGAGLFYRFLGAKGIGGVVALSICSFVLTRYSHGQVAFLAGVGLALGAVATARDSRRIFLYMFLASLLSPHAGLIGVLVFFVVCRKKWFPIAAILGAAAGLWPTVLAGYGTIGDVREFAATRPWYETLLLQSGFWHQDVGTFGSMLVLMLAAAALWSSRARSMVLLRMWSVACVVYLTARVVKHTLIESDAVAFLRDEHKIMVLGAVSLCGLAGIFIEGNKRLLYAVFSLATLCVGAWSANTQGGFSERETAALSSLSEDVNGEVAVWPASRYNRLSEAGVVAQDAVSRVLDRGTYRMGESGERSLMSEWMASGGETDFQPYFSTLVIVKYGQQGYEWLERIGNQRTSSMSNYEDFFTVVDLEVTPKNAGGGLNVVVPYYAAVILLSVASLKRPLIRHPRVLQSVSARTGYLDKIGPASAAESSPSGEPDGALE